MPRSAHGKSSPSCRCQKVFVPSCIWPCIWPCYCSSREYAEIAGPHEAHVSISFTVGGRSRFALQAADFRILYQKKRSNRLALDDGF